MGGFTMIEFLIVFAVISMITVVAIPVYHTMKQNVVLHNETQQLVDILRTAQNRAIASEDYADHGVHCETDNCILFRGSWGSPCSAPSCVNENIHYFGNGITAQLPKTILFKRLTGSAVVNPTDTIDIGYSSGGTRRITIYSIGRIIAD